MPPHPSITGRTVNTVWVDPDVCLAHYMCVPEAPLVFEQQENQWVVGIKPTANQEVIAQNTEALFWAATVCPVSAIKLTLENGEVIDGDSKLLKEFVESH